MSTTSVTAPPSAPPDALALFASGTTELPAVFHEYLAAGGELAAINVLPLTEDNIKAAIPALTARDFTALSSLIDSTGQLSPEERAVLDDVPPGEGQLTAARAALTECLSAPNLTFIALATLRPSQLRAVALEALITPDQINEDLGKIDRILRLTVRIYKAVPFNVFNNRLVPKKRPAQDDGLSSSSKRLRGAQSQAAPPPARRMQRLQGLATVYQTADGFPLRRIHRLSVFNPLDSSRRIYRLSLTAPEPVLRPTGRRPRRTRCSSSLSSSCCPRVSLRRNSCSRNSRRRNRVSRRYTSSSPPPPATFPVPTAVPPQWSSSSASI
jgi:hypothetical protein